MIRLVLMSFYRLLCLALSFILGKVVFSRSRKAGSVSEAILTLEYPSSKSRLRIWFHAASVGELECISTLIFKAAEEGHELILTTLSESTHQALEDFRLALVSKSARVIFIGYSPLEGAWFNTLSEIKPSIFITAKYEAWPDLWLSLAQLEIPLLIVSARMRRSFRIVRIFCRILLGRLPVLYFFTAQSQDDHSLIAAFPHAEVKCVGEPRWDRVSQRRNTGHAKAHELIHCIEGKMSRPWGILGSVWLDDLKVFGSALRLTEGSLLIVPHRIDSDSVRIMAEYLKSELGLNPILTSKRHEMIQKLQKNAGDSRARDCIIVNEMGFLSELYASASWVFVGGGFTHGVHSTIEPAIYGVPIACGPLGVEKFVETLDLERSGQLKVVKDSQALREWLSEVVITVNSPEYKARWLVESQRRLGATQKIWDTLEKIK